MLSRGPVLLIFRSEQNGHFRIHDRHLTCTAERREVQPAPGNKRTNTVPFLWHGCNNREYTERLKYSGKERIVFKILL